MFGSDAPAARNVGAYNPTGFSVSADNTSPPAPTILPTASTVAMSCAGSHTAGAAEGTVSNCIAGIALGTAESSSDGALEYAMPVMMPLQRRRCSAPVDEAYKLASIFSSVQGVASLELASAEGANSEFKFVFCCPFMDQMLGASCVGRSATGIVAAEHQPKVLRALRAVSGDVRCGSNVVSYGTGESHVESAGGLLQEDPLRDIAPADMDDGDLDRVLADFDTCMARAAGLGIVDEAAGPSCAVAENVAKVEHEVAVNNTFMKTGVVSVTADAVKPGGERLPVVITLSKNPRSGAVCWHQMPQQAQ